MAQYNTITFSYESIIYLAIQTPQPINVIKNDERNLLYMQVTYQRGDITYMQAMVDCTYILEKQALD